MSLKNMVGSKNMVDKLRMVKEFFSKQYNTLVKILNQNNSVIPYTLFTHPYPNSSHLILYPNPYPNSNSNPNPIPKSYS